jgi:hypothetical protein
MLVDTSAWVEFLRATGTLLGPGCTPRVSA